jgi:hypothetical protein
MSVLIVVGFGLLRWVRVSLLDLDRIEFGAVVAARGRWEGEYQRCVRTDVLSGEEVSKKPAQEGITRKQHILLK